METVMEQFQRRPKIIQDQLRGYAIAMMLTAAALSVNEFVIGMIVSNILGAAAFTTVAASLPVYGVCSSAAAFFGVGGGLICGQALGRMDRKTARQIFSADVYIALTTGVLAMALAILFMPQLSSLLASGDVENTARLERYLRYLLPGAPLVMLMTVLSKFLTQSGSPSLAARLLILANAVSVIGTYVLLKFCGFGVEGAALAINLGYVSAVVVFISLLLRSRLSLRFVRAGRREFSQLRHGVPAGLSAGSMFFWFMLQVYCMNRLAYEGAGQTGMALHGVCLGVNSILSVILYGIVDAMMPMLAVMSGTKDSRAQGFILKRCYGLAFVCVGGCALLLGLFPDVVFAVYGMSDPSLLVPGRTALRVYLTGFCGTAMIVCFQLHLAFLKHNVFANFASFLKSAAIVLPLGSILVPVYGLNGLWISYMISGVAALCIVMAYTGWLAHKSKGELATVFLLPRPKTCEMLDFTVDCRITKEIAALSAAVIEQTKTFGLNEKAREYIGLAVEEMGLLLQQMNKGKSHALDVLIYREKQGTRVVFRDLGTPLNVMEQEHLDRPLSGVRMLRMIADSVSYERVLLMNQHTFCLNSDK